MTHTLTPTADLATDIDDVARLLTPDGERITDPELDRWVVDVDATTLRGLYRDMVLLRRIETEGPHPVESLRAVDGDRSA